MTLGLLVLTYLLFVMIPGIAAGFAGFYCEREPAPYGGLVVPNIIVAIWGGICAIVVLFGNAKDSFHQVGPVFWFAVVLGIVSSVWLVGTFLFVSPQVRAALKSLRRNTPPQASKSTNELI